MACERINPRDYSGEPISLDHYARYAFAGQFASGKQVLDAACGLGYGSDYLRAAGAIRVVGVDVAVDAIRLAREQYQADGLSFEIADVHHLSASPGGHWDLIASFETIEHLADPPRFIAECRGLLAPGGVLVASVPNAAQDPEGANEFHIQRFNRASFEQLLRTAFNVVDILPQYFSLASLIHVGPDAHVAELSENVALSASADSRPTEPDCFIAVCANDRSSVRYTSVLVHARKFWEHHQEVLLGKHWLEKQLADLEHLVAETSAELDRQRILDRELEEGRRWLEEQRERWQQTASQQAVELERQRARFEELEEGKRWLAEERAKWEQKATELSNDLEKS